MLLTLAAPAEIYKWVDDEGKVHYGEKSPNTNTDRAVETIKIKDAVSTSNNQRANEAFKKKSKSLDENRKKRKKEKLAKKKKAGKQAEQKKACEEAKAILAGLQMPRVALTDGDEYVWLDEEEKQVKIKEVKVLVKTLCN
jgi:FKBP-type peptidyl-prolyl cis-trans isomerase